MPRLSSRDVAALLEVVRQTYAQRSAQALGQHLVRTLPTLVDSEVIAYSQIDPRDAHRDAIELYNTPELCAPKPQALFRQFMGEHPVIVHYAKTGDGRARKISDFMTRRQLHRTALYNEYVRPYVGVEDQLAIAMTATPSRVVGVALSRSGREYSERERMLLDLLRPHLVQAHRTAAILEQQQAEIAALRLGLDAAAIGIILLDARGQRRSVTARARTALRKYFGMTRGRDLPDPLAGWVRSQLRPSNADGPPEPRTPLRVTHEAHELSIRIVPDANGHLLLLEERRITPDYGALTERGLTPKEIEVLVWVAAAKTNAETAAIIGGRPRTVEKHLERIYRKLGVENRTAAAAAVRDLNRRRFD